MRVQDRAHSTSVRERVPLIAALHLHLLVGTTHTYLVLRTITILQEYQLVCGNV